MNRRVPYDNLKRALDIVAAGAGLVLLSPVLAGVALAVERNLGQPVLFCQPRAGRDGRVFLLLKFRTMRSPDPTRGLVTDEERLTPFGRTLRATSLDELPSLWNVLLGDMSIVGPRPLLVRYLDRYTVEQMRRHEVRPGITGLAQARGRNELSWDERFALDVDYVDRRCLTLDARILVETAVAVMRRDGITSPGHVTMPEFQGCGGST
jgi:lipopolysaccharide/colanic/teichoic acid biosynthesis glycosyltransferase